MAPVSMGPGGSRWVPVGRRRDCDRIWGSRWTASIASTGVLDSEHSEHSEHRRGGYARCDSELDSEHSEHRRIDSELDSEHSEHRRGGYARCPEMAKKWQRNGKEMGKKWRAPWHVRPLVALGTCAL